MDMVVHLDVPEEEILGRIKDRWIHAPSGRVYNSIYNPPKVAGIDDVTGEPLTKRPDDDLATLKKRIVKFKDTALPLLRYYDGKSILRTVHGRSTDEMYPVVSADVATLLESEKLAERQG